MRIIGTDSHLTLDLQDIDSITKVFSDRYQKTFGFKPSGKIEIASIKVEVYGTNIRIPEIKIERESGNSLDSSTNHEIFFENEYCRVPFFSRSSIPVYKK